MLMSEEHYVCIVHACNFTELRELTQNPHGVHSPWEVKGKGKIDNYGYSHLSPILFFF